MITLSDVTEFIRNGASIKQEKGCGGLPITRIETISNNVFNYDKMGYADINDDKYKDYYLKNYDVLLSHINSVKYLGRAVIYKQIDENPIIHGMNLLCLRFDLQKYNPEFFCYYSRSNIAKMYIANNTKKSVNQASITATAIKNMPIPDLSLELQSSIVDRLNKLQNIIELKNEQISKLDELVKSQFVEMFGDPETESCIYPTFKLKELSIKISDGVHSKPEYTDKGRPFLSVVNINRKKVDFTNCKFVSEESYQKMIKSTHPEKGDVLYTKVGATYGIPAYVDTDIEFCLYVSVCLIKPKHDLINSKYLAIQMDMPFVKHQADRRIKGIGVPDLHLNQISEFDIICPPREIQDSFVCFVEQTDKSKLAVQKSIEKLEILKKSLMQEYFG